MCLSARSGVGRVVDRVSVVDRVAGGVCPWPRWWTASPVVLVRGRREEGASSLGTDLLHPQGADLLLLGALVRVVSHLPVEAEPGSASGPELIDLVHGVSRLPVERAFVAVTGLLLGQVAHGANDRPRYSPTGSRRRRGSVHRLVESGLRAVAVISLGPVSLGPVAVLGGWSGGSAVSGIEAPLGSVQQSLDVVRVREPDDGQSRKEI